METGDKVFLVANSEALSCYFVGGGATVLCFIPEGAIDTVYLFLADLSFNDGYRMIDTAKDVMVSAYNLSKENKYLPKIEFLNRAFVEGEELNKDCNVYKMKFYKDLSPSDKKAWIDMKILHKLRADGMREVLDDYRKKTGKPASLTFLGSEAAKRTVSLARTKLKKNKEMVQALESLYAGICSQSDPSLTFEFNKRNVGVDEDGHLIMRDPVYSADITVRIKADRAENRRIRRKNEKEK